MPVFHDAGLIAVIYFAVTFLRMPNTNVVNFLNLYDTYKGNWTVPNITSNQSLLSSEFGFVNTTQGSAEGVFQNNLIASLNLIDEGMKNQMLQIAIENYDVNRG